MFETSLLNPTVTLLLPSVSLRPNQTSWNSISTLPRCLLSLITQSLLIHHLVPTPTLPLTQLSWRSPMSSLMLGPTDFLELLTNLTFLSHLVCWPTPPWNFSISLQDSTFLPPFLGLYLPHCFAGSSSCSDGFGLQPFPLLIIHTPSWSLSYCCDFIHHSLASESQKSIPSSHLSPVPRLIQTTAYWTSLSYVTSSTNSASPKLINHHYPTSLPLKWLFLRNFTC